MIDIAIPNYDIVKDCWDEIEPFIQRAIDESNDEMNIDTVLNRIDKKELLLATVFKDGKLVAVVVYELTIFESGKRAIHIQLAGGDNMDEWFEQIEQIANDLAKVQDCSEVYIIGRKGWERQMKHLGYNHVHTIISKKVK